MTSSKTPEEERRKNRPHISSAIEKSVSQQISKTQVAGHSGGQRQLIKVNRKLDDSAKGKIALCKRRKQIMESLCIFEYCPWRPERVISFLTKCLYLRWNKQLFLFKQFKGQVNLKALPNPASHFFPPTVFPSNGCIRSHHCVDSRLRQPLDEETPISASACRATRFSIYVASLSRPEHEIGSQCSGT